MQKYQDRKILALSIFYIIFQFAIAPFLLNFFSYKQGYMLIYFIIICAIGTYSIYLLKDKLLNNLKEIIAHKKYILMMLAILLICLLLIPFLLIPSSTSQAGISFFEENTAPINHFLFIICLIFFAPVIEEMVFQFILQTNIQRYFISLKLNRTYSQIFSIIITSLIFIFIHILGNFSLSAFGPYIIIFGYAICYISSKQNLLLTIILHMLWNAFPYLVAFTLTMLNISWH